MTNWRTNAMVMALASSVAVSPAAQRSVPGALTISGRVVDAGDGVPVPFARLELVAAGAHDPLGGRSARTDGQGRFTIDRLGSGGYYLAATKPGYAPSYYAANEASTVQPGSLITLKADVPTDLTIRLVRGGVVTGRVVDAFGSAGIGIAVQLERVAPRSSNERFYALDYAPVVTNARGEYRAYGLGPGEYRMSVAPSGTATAVGVAGSRPMKFVNTYYPGVVDPSLARTIAVMPGAEVGGIDVALQLHPVFSVSGRVEGREGGRAIPVRVSGPVTASAILNDDGAFRFGDAFIPGRYRLTAIVDAPNAERVRWGVTEIAVTDRDIDDAMLVLQPAMIATGRVVRADGRSPGLVIVSMIPEVDAGLLPTGGAIAADGTFIITKLMAGRYRIRVSSRAESLPASVFLDGQELPNGVIDLAPGQNIESLVLRLD